MITIQDITKSLSPIIEFSIIDECKVIILFRTNDETNSVKVESFQTLFLNADDMSAKSLLAIDNGSMGYEEYINEWQNKGYIV